MPHLCHSSGKAGWLLRSPVSSVLLLLSFSLSSIHFLMEKAVQSLFSRVSIFFFSSNSAQSSHATEIFSHVGWDVTCYTEAFLSL